MTWQNRRFRRHVMLAGSALLLIALLFFAFGFAPERWTDPPMRKAESAIWRLSMATAYTAFSFLAVTLIIGPLTVLRSRPNPISTMFRRDVGIWAGVLALTHMTVGMLVHTESLKLWWLFFTELPSLDNPLPLRISKFGLANYLGIFQATLFVLLLLISNNRALRRLGTRRWKMAQRLVYVVFASVAAHGFVYQLVEQRDGRIITIFLLMIFVVVIVQLLGAWRYRQKHAARSTQTNILDPFLVRNRTQMNTDEHR